MLHQILLFSAIIGVAYANLFDFIQNHFHAEDGRGHGRTPLQHEESILNSNCDGYLCQDTNICVESPKFCPCPYPSSQIRCFLPDGKFLCISKPAGEISSKYEDPATNWKIDAKDDNIRDCGWVSRAWKGLV